MNRILFIFNRHAGKNKTWAGMTDILDAMTGQNCLVTAYPTQCRGDATEAVVRWGKDFDRVVVAGGDGTLSEAIAGARQLDTPIVIGYIPVGTTNDFSRNLDLPSYQLKELAVTAVSGTPRQHDLGSFNGKPFLYVAAFGAFTEVSYSTPQKYKNVLGYNAYVLEGIRNLSSIKPYHIQLEYDDGENGRQVLEGDYIYGMVSNSTSVGRIRNFPPGNPDLSDGLLEVTLISPIRGAKSMDEFTRAVEEISRTVLSGDPGALTSIITSFSTPRVTITSDDGLAWTLDGEEGGIHNTAQVEAIHNAYTIVHGTIQEPEALSNPSQALPDSSNPPQTRTEDAAESESGQNHQLTPGPLGGKIHQQDENNFKEAIPMRKILLPIDGSKRSIRTVEFVKQSIRPEDCEITVVKVIGAQLYLNSMEEIKYRAEQVRPELDAVADMLKGYQVNTQVLLGSSPGVEIVEYAREMGADIIVMTRSSRGPIRKLGSVAAHIVKNASFLDVFVMREEDD